MDRFNFRYGKYMNRFVLLRLVYEWVGVRGLQPHVRIQNHGKLTPPPPCIDYVILYCDYVHFVDKKEEFIPVYM